MCCGQQSWFTVSLPMSDSDMKLMTVDQLFNVVEICLNLATMTMMHPGILDQNVVLRLLCEFLQNFDDQLGLRWLCEHDDTA